MVIIAILFFVLALMFAAFAFIEPPRPVAAVVRFIEPRLASGLIFRLVPEAHRFRAIRLVGAGVLVSVGVACLSA
jgi:hypothetical protein